MLRLCVAAIVLTACWGEASAQQRPRPSGPPVAGGEQAMANQILELRTYTLTGPEAEAKLDAFLESALIPALQRQGLGPIGVFDQAKVAEGADVEVLLLIPGPSVAAVTSASANLAKDSKFQEAASEYNATDSKSPIVKRIRSELLVSFDCWPQVKVPQQTNEGKDRYFELRSYESPTEHLGELKVEMFNAGEVPIFLDSGIAPVFMGQAVVGFQMPNLTYMTVFDNEDARNAAWDNFRNHADWKTLSANPRYKGTVSKNNMSFWVPKSYSKL